MEWKHEPLFGTSGAKRKPSLRREKSVPARLAGLQSFGVRQACGPDEFVHERFLRCSSLKLTRSFAGSRIRRRCRTTWPPASTLRRRSRRDNRASGCLAVSAAVSFVHRAATAHGFEEVLARSPARQASGGSGPSNPFAAAVIRRENPNSRRFAGRLPHLRVQAFPPASMSRSRFSTIAGTLVASKPRRAKPRPRAHLRAGGSRRSARAALP